MEGLLYLEKYSIGGPEFGIKKEFVAEKGRQLFHAPAMNREACKLQALVYDILPSNTAVFSYAIGSRKL